MFFNPVSLNRREGINDERRHQLEGLEFLQWDNTFFKVVYGLNGQHESVSPATGNWADCSKTVRAEVVTYLSCAVRLNLRRWGGAGLYPWTLVSQHERSCAVRLREGRGFAFPGGSDREVGVSAVEEAPLQERTAG